MPITVLNEFLPADYDHGSDFGPTFEIDEYVSTSRVVQEVNLWAGRYYSGSIAYTHRSQSVVEAVRKLFLVCRTNGLACLLFDQKEHQGVDEPLLQLTSLTYQLRTRLVVGAHTVYRTVRHPIHGSLTVLANGALRQNTVTIKSGGVSLPEGGNWSVDNTTGIVTFNAPPTSPTASFLYGTPVRFQDKQLDIYRRGVEWGIRNLRLFEVNA